MSARPRPVTATIGYSPRITSPMIPRSGELDSTGDSTKSLISVLDHEDEDNYDGSASEDGIEEPKTVEKRIETKAEKNENKIEKDSSEIENINPKKDDSILDDESSKRLEKIVSQALKDYNESESIASEKGPEPLSPWEKWLISKAKDDRINKRKERIEEKKKWLEEQQKEMEKRQMKMKCAEKHKEWVQEKNEKEKAGKRVTRQKQRTEQELKNEEKRHIEEKAKQKFEEWMKKKADEEETRKKEEEARKKKEADEKEKKRQECDRVYQEWCVKANERLKSAKDSERKMTGYYDRTAYPPPSYYNPIPWQPIHIPRPEKKKIPAQKKKKKAWNPDKYY